MSETSGPEEDLRGIETPEEDAAEQLADAAGEDEGPEWPQQIPFDADEADVAENARQVRLDEDDYR
ncbi:hypothetical protein J4573_49100 [Actinomadura barringtoniae]|uniref:Uncharacterized protein n=1 Tax=Actinomadura barringtoniae TaxID=1427535 RepID=A0A939PMP9_9ACTN|nr:hypothetical protein [Actinomadura barringtoniae]MBO2455120.1 hypothetical protein [Actinomadura barringtoniae]